MRLSSADKNDVKISHFLIEKADDFKRHKSYPDSSATYSNLMEEIQPKSMIAQVVKRYCETFQPHYQGFGLIFSVKLP